MRNGNISPASFGSAHNLSCSYPTYEEWKHSKLTFSLYIIIRVLILPMRNGNCNHGRDYIKSIFCSYPTYEEWKPIHLLPIFVYLILCSYPTYEEWKHTKKSFQEPIRPASFLSYLWGMETVYLGQIPIFVSNVLILPMRNGNRVLIQTMNGNWLSSYPTYEEWKRFNLIDNLDESLKEFLSYLWGMETLLSPFSSPFLISCSYPTYEEWKPRWAKFTK